MNADTNHFSLNFDSNRLTIHVNDRLVAAYLRRDLAPNVLEVLFGKMQLLFCHSDSDKESFEDMTAGFRIPGRGPCSTCGRNTNLFGGLCYRCSHGGPFR